LKANLLKRFFDRYPKMAKEVYVVMPTDVERLVEGPFTYTDSGGGHVTSESLLEDSPARGGMDVKGTQPGERNSPKPKISDVEWATKLVAQFAVVLPRYDDSLTDYEDKMIRELTSLKMELYYH